MYKFNILILLLFIWFTYVTYGEEILRPTLIIPAKAELGEGSLWDNEKKVLYWIDIEGRALHVYDPRSNMDQVFKLDAMPGTVVSRRGGKVGEVVIPLSNGIFSYNYITKEKVLLAHPESISTNRYNDGKVDPNGRLWVGTMSLKNGQPAEASLFSIEHNQSKRMLEQVRISNGIVWTSDQKTMYYIDTPTNGVDAFDYDKASGSISNRRRVVYIRGDYGFPDGMTIDADNMIWVAHYDGHRVTRWNPKTGELLLTVQLPVSKVTSVAFGGDNLSTLYITTARAGEESKGGGGLWALDLSSKGIKGVPATPYNG